MQGAILHAQGWKEYYQSGLTSLLERSLERDVGLELQHVQVVVAPLLLKPPSKVHYRLLPLPGLLPLLLKPPSKVHYRLLSLPGLLPLLLIHFLTHWAWNCPNNHNITVLHLLLTINVWFIITITFTISFIMTLIIT